MRCKRLSCALLFVLTVLTLLGCSVNASEKVFSLPKDSHRIDGTVLYNDVNFFEGLYFDMSYDDYMDMADDRYGEEASATYTVPSVIEEEGYTWQVVQTKLYDETKDMNSYVNAIFLEGKLDQVQAGSLVYATSESNFKERAEILIDEHSHIIERLKDSDLDEVEGSYKSYDEWEHREWWTEKKVEGTNISRFVECFNVDISLPDKAEEGGYIVSPYENGEAGVVVFLYSRARTTRSGPNFDDISDNLMWFERNPSSYLINGDIIPMFPES